MIALVDSPEKLSVIGGRFALQSVAGSGGMATVYKGRDLSSGQPVAVKLLDVHGRPQESDRFAREGQILAQLRHPGIVGYIAHGVTERGQPFLVMDWLEGEDLSRRLARGALSFSESISLLRKIAEALQIAHQRGIVHRDLKPSNLFLLDGSLDKVIILDFGIAHHEARSQAMTRTGSVLGTPDYMAPEQARGQRELMPAADIFSLGCVLYECLVGQPPFRSEHLVAVLAKILFDECPSVRNLKPELPVAIDELLQRMLTKESQERIADASVLLEQLAKVEELATPAGPDATNRSLDMIGAVQSLVSIILVALPGLASDTATTLADSDLGGRVELLRQSLRPANAHVELLADGSVVVTFDKFSGEATDLATKSARCALLIRELWPDAQIVCCTGRGEVSKAVPLGEALDRASRLLLEAPHAGQVLLDEVTAALLSNRFHTTRLNTNIYVLTAAVEEGDATRTLLGRPTPCVGRDQELGTLELALRVCVDDGCSRVMLVTAPPGMGKSRLRHEFVRRIESRMEDVQLLFGRGEPMSEGSVYGLLAQALRRLCEIRDADDPATARDKLFQRLTRHLALPGPEQQRVVEFLGELCGVPFLNVQSMKLRAARQEPRLMTEQITRAMIDLLRAECLVHPTLLILDDLQWGDLPTVHLLSSVLDELTDQPFMLLALGRPEVEKMFPNLWSGRAQPLPLRPLAKRASERLVQQVLGNQVSPTMVLRIVEHAAGNALLLEELVRAAAEGRGDTTPDSVLAILQARIGRLNPLVRRVLVAASVYGHTFRCSGVKAVVGTHLGGSSVERWLEILVAEEFLTTRQDGTTAEIAEYNFRHSLVLDAAYSLLGSEDRTVAHRRAGEYLERTTGHDPMSLAVHYERGGDLVRAGHFFALAARRAHSIADTDTAIALAHRGLAFPLPDDIRAALLARLTECHAWAGDYAGAVPFAQEALRLATPGSGPWFTAVAMRASSAMLVQQVDVVMQMVDLARQTTIASDAIDEASFALRSLLDTLFLLGQCDRASEQTARLRVLADACGDGEVLVAAWAALSQAIDDSWRCETPERALMWGQRASTFFEQIGHRRGMLFAKIYSGMNLWALGDFAHAEQELRATLVAGTEFGRVSARRTAYLIEVLLDSGQTDAAHSMAQDMLAAARQRNRTWDEGNMLWALADVHARRGELLLAEQAVVRSCELLQASPILEVAAKGLRAAIVLRAGRTSEALSLAEQTMQQYMAMPGFGWRLAQARLTYVRCLLATGQQDLAREQLAGALAALDRRAQLIVDAALQQSFRRRVVEHAETLALATELGLPGP